MTHKKPAAQTNTKNQDNAKSDTFDKQQMSVIRDITSFYNSRD